MLENQAGCSTENPQNQTQSSQGKECPTNFADLDDKLEELKKAAGNKAADLAYAQRAKDSYETDFKELEKAIPDFKKIVTEYNKVRLELKKEWEDLEAYRYDKKAMVEVAVGSQLQEIIEIIECEKSGIKKLECTILPSKKEAVTGKWIPETSEKKGKEYELQESQDELANKTACFEAWKIKQRITEDTIKNLKDLRDLIELKENETEKNKFVIMYYYLTKFEDVQYKFNYYYVPDRPCDLDKDKEKKCQVTFFSENEDDKTFETDLIKAWCELHQAKQDVLMKQRIKDEAVRDLEDTKKEITEKKANLENETLERLKEKIKITVTCKKHSLN